jgi:hypothetical protein
MVGIRAAPLAIEWISRSRGMPPTIRYSAQFAKVQLKVGGVIAFDDYLWAVDLPGGVDPIRCPKPAIDAFTNIYCRKMNIVSAPLVQLYIQKISE